MSGRDIQVEVVVIDDISNTMQQIAGFLSKIYSGNQFKSLVEQGAPTLLGTVRADSLVFSVSGVAA